MLSLNALAFLNSYKLCTFHFCVHFEFERYPEFHHVLFNLYQALKRDVKSLIEELKIFVGVLTKSNAVCILVLKKQYFFEK